MHLFDEFVYIFTFLIKIWFDLSSPEISEEAREVLKKFDLDNDGKVTRIELENLLMKYNTIRQNELNALMRFVSILFNEVLQQEMKCMIISTFFHENIVSTTTTGSEDNWLL